MSKTDDAHVQAALARLEVLRSENEQAITERLSGSPGLADWTLRSVGPVLAALAGPHLPKRSRWRRSPPVRSGEDPATGAAAGFYIGECFVRAHPGLLRWEIMTDPDYSDYLRPVVAGFEPDSEMVVERVGATLLRRVRDGGPDRAADVVRSWSNLVPRT